MGEKNEGGFDSVEDLVEFLRRTLDLKEDEAINVIKPQHERKSKEEVWYYPRTARDFRGIEKLPDSALRSMGLRLWKKFEKEGVTYEHYLYPGEWYAYIPEGFAVTDLDGEAEIFKPGISCKDIRFGCLAYGFVRESKEE